MPLATFFFFSCHSVFLIMWLIVYSEVFAPIILRLGGVTVNTQQNLFVLRFCGLRWKVWSLYTWHFVSTKCSGWDISGLILVQIRAIVFICFDMSQNKSVQQSLSQLSLLFRLVVLDYFAFSIFKSNMKGRAVLLYLGSLIFWQWLGTRRLSCVNIWNIFF